MDWKHELDTVSDAREIAMEIHERIEYSDFVALAKLHRQGVHRRKIEKLLSYCKARTEKSLMQEGLYREALRAWTAAHRKAVLYVPEIAVAIMAAGHKWRTEDRASWELVAEKTGVSMKILDRVRERQPVPIHTARKIADRLDIDYIDAFAYVDERPPRPRCNHFERGWEMRYFKIV